MLAFALNVKTENDSFISCLFPIAACPIVADFFSLCVQFLGICCRNNFHVSAVLPCSPRLRPLSRSTNLRSSVKPCSPQCVQKPVSKCSMLSHWQASRHQNISFADRIWLRKTRHIIKWRTAIGRKFQEVNDASQSLTKISFTFLWRYTDCTRFS